jgi:hypothetical protein
MPLTFFGSSGKFGRVKLNGTPVAGLKKWKGSFKRERQDLTNFESVVSASGLNVFSEGTTGILDSVFDLEGYVNLDAVGQFFPDEELEYDFLLVKVPELGYQGIAADTISYDPGAASRGVLDFTAQVQSNGLVAPS